MLNGFQNPRMIKLIVISGTVNYDDWGVSDEISLHLDSRCFTPPKIIVFLAKIM